MATIKGVVKKTSYDQYKNVRNSGLIAINLDDGDELKWIRTSSGENEVVISTSLGQAIRFHEKEVRPMGRVSRACAAFDCDRTTMSLVWTLSMKIQTYS